MLIGRVEVGTETLIDKSKSTKTVLMELFKGNSDIEGATIVNACYGGTAAFLNACAWCSLEERLAIVVAADIATYAEGPARPTCGVGAVAVLVGRDAPLVLGERATHASHVWDFYKPNPVSEYPVVEGALSQLCYYQALEDCYERWSQKTQMTAISPNYWVFHAPYNKLVQKSYARLFYIDDLLTETKDTTLQKWRNMDRIASYHDKTLEAVLKQQSAQAYQDKLTDANHASQQVGNTYTASVFLGLCSLISRRSLQPAEQIAVFSYGSGALATLYSLHV
jgi:hydroxymethylglutaryl-CoA synthase